MSQRDIEKRLEASVRRSYYKRWFQRPWGRLVLFGGILVAIFVAYYVYLTAQYYHDLTTFDFQKPIAELLKDETFKKLVTADDPAKGNPEAKVFIVEFADYQCPFCKQAEPILQQVMKKYGDKVYFMLRDYPITSTHPEALAAAEAANCAGEQDQYWEYHDQLFARQDELSSATFRSIAEALGLDMPKFNVCLNTHATQAEIQADAADGANLGVNGTPTFFINGQMFPGVLKYDFWDKVLTFLLSDNSQ
ncbi:MAG: thioredoxin domain-containing protein [Candidatus Komeilibacteria bacterium]